MNRIRLLQKANTILMYEPAFPGIFPRNSNKHTALNKLLEYIKTFALDARTELFQLITQTTEIQIDICPISFHREQLDLNLSF